MAIVAGFAITPSLADSPDASKKIRILVVHGGHAFEVKPFFAIFEAMPEMVVTRAELPKQADLLRPGLEKTQDVIVRYDMVPEFSAEQRKAFAALLKSGIGFVALHHNMGAHRNWPEYRKMIGGKFIFKAGEIDGEKVVPSGWKHGQDIEVTVADKKHPITQGIGTFQIHDETYNNYYTSSQVKVLLRTDHPKNDPELAWTTSYGKSRVFYLMLGHDHFAYENPNYRQLVRQGIHWVAAKKEKSSN